MLYNLCHFEGFYGCWIKLFLYVLGLKYKNFKGKYLKIGYSWSVHKTSFLWQFVFFIESNSLFCLFHESVVLLLRLKVLTFTMLRHYLKRIIMLNLLNQAIKIFFPKHLIFFKVIFLILLTFNWNKSSSVLKNM